MTTSARRPVSTPVGPARLWLDEAERPRLRLALGHGASGGPDVPDLRALAETLPAEGVSVVRVEQPWRVAGRKVASRPEVLDDGWRAALAELPRDIPLAVGGRSAGARVACRTAADTAAAGVLALAFPLHPPGKPERSRLPELVDAAAKLPVLVVQGERDTFGRPEEFPAGAGQLVSVAAADHSMKVPKGFDQRAALDAVVETVRAWLSSLPAIPR